jgi:UDP-glucose 4-epimerase
VVRSVRVLLTGGTGYIGSHVAVALAEAGHEPVLMDNFSNSTPLVLEGIAKIIGHRPEFHHRDVRDEGYNLDWPVDAVIHLAGFKSVPGSFQKPLAYYTNNLGCTLALLNEMRRRGVHNMVFSSSATVYGPKAPLPYREDYGLDGTASSPYAQTKIMGEQMLADLAGVEKHWQFGVLRYFNPAGAHPSGLIGESPTGIPENLFPFITQVLSGKRSRLTVYGRDYDTPDGTCQRDYIHVMDLARAHVLALGKSGRWNIGTGRPASVLDVIKAFEHASGHRVRHQYGPRRDGDLPLFWADPTKAKDELGWEAERTLGQMAEDAWRFART